ncbi:hypothetical protein [Brevibacillus reuszeri]|uniref:hypothetical protein n=1 Tax=Brevibacillus reuszeri TaxID=54915 RepID=UPI003D24228E
MSVNPFSSSNLYGFEKYLDSLNLREDTINYYISEAKRFIQWTATSTKSKTLNSYYQDYYAYLESTFSKSVILKKKSAINSFAEFLSHTKLTENHFDTINTIIYPYTNKEIEFLKTIMLAAGNNITRFRNLLIVELALQGLSMKEITHFRINQLNIEKNEIQLSDRHIKILYPDSLLRYFEAWKTIFLEKNGEIEGLLITPLHDNRKPLRNSVIIKWFALISDLGGITVTIEKLNLTYLHTLIAKGYSDNELLSQIGPHIKKLIPSHIDFYRTLIRKE